MGKNLKFNKENILFGLLKTEETFILAESEVMFTLSSARWR